MSFREALAPRRRRISHSHLLMMDGCQGQLTTVPRCLVAGLVAYVLPIAALLICDHFADPHGAWGGAVGIILSFIFGGMYGSLFVLPAYGAWFLLHAARAAFWWLAGLTGLFAGLIFALTLGNDLTSHLRIYSPTVTAASDGIIGFITGLAVWFTAYWAPPKNAVSESL